MNRLDFFIAEVSLYDASLLEDFLEQGQSEEYILLKHKSNPITLKLVMRTDGSVSLLLRNYETEKILSNPKLCPSALVKYFKEDSVKAFIDS